MHYYLIGLCKYDKKEHKKAFFLCKKVDFVKQK